MPNIYVRSTDGSDSDDGSTWALAKATLVGASGIDAAGDTIYVSQSHNESSSATQTIALAGTYAAPVRIICANDGASPPTAVASTGAVTTTGASNITITGSGYVEGLTFNVGTGPTSASMCFGVSGSAAAAIKCKNCNFKILNTGTTSASVMVGYNALANPTRIVWEDCGVMFSVAAQLVRVNSARFYWHGGSLLSGGTSPTNLISFNYCGAEILLDGINLSSASSSINIFTSGAAHPGTAIIRNSTLPDSWSGALGTPSGPQTRYEMHNCDSADTNYRMVIADYAGEILSETTLVRTGGASDGTTPISWKMAASANANYPTVPLVSPEISLWNETTGSSKTVTVEILHDSATNLKDDEIWLEVQYLGTSGYPLGSFITDCKADVLATAADQTDSSETWTTTGMSNPNTQKLSVSFTPQEKGYFQAKVYLAKASTTVYVDPKLTVA